MILIIHNGTSYYYNVSVYFNFYDENDGTHNSLAYRVSTLENAGFVTTNTTYSLTGSGSTITLSGSDGSSSSRTISVDSGITETSITITQSGDYIKTDVNLKSFKMLYVVLTVTQSSTLPSGSFYFKPNYTTSDGYRYYIIGQNPGSVIGLTMIGVAIYSSDATQLVLSNCKYGAATSSSFTSYRPTVLELYGYK